MRMISGLALVALMAFMGCAGGCQATTGREDAPMRPAPAVGDVGPAGDQGTGMQVPPRSHSDTPANDGGATITNP